MKFTDFFIDRPVFATILNALIILLGLMSLQNMSVREYPQVDLPVITVQAFYPNASAELIEASVTNYLEDSFAGVENLDTITSTTRQGSTFIRLKLKAGTSMDRAMIQARDAISRVRGDLPLDVKEPVVERGLGRYDGPPFMMLALINQHMPLAELTHFANLVLKNPLRSLDGVATIEVWGQPYTMALTLDSKKMHAFGVNVGDISSVLKKNNTALPAGKFREEVPISLDLRLTDPEAFAQILIKENKGHPVYLHDVADVALKVDTQSFRTRVNGQQGLILSVQRSSDSNPLDVSEAVHAQVKRLQTYLPEDTTLSVQLDQADFIRASLKNVRMAILEAIILVLLIIFLFLRNIRASLIPLLTIPISLIGTATVLYTLGFSINTVTLLAMVLAIGLVVDDAIVVLENIHRFQEQGFKPFEAAKQGTRQIGFAIVAMTLTLASVYTPIAFLQDTIGQIFLEFAVALAGAVIVSGFVALTLSPMMCARVLKPTHHTFLPQIDRWLDALTQKYAQLLSWLPKHLKLFALISTSILVAMVVFFRLLPMEIAPKEDRGLVGIFMPPIPGKGIEALDLHSQNMEALVKDLPEKENYITFMGEWGANVVLTLADWSKRSQSASALVEKFRKQTENYPSIDIWPWNWDSGLPNMNEAGDLGAVPLVVMTIGTYRELYQALENFRETLENSKTFQDVSQTLKLNSPAYNINANRLTLAELHLTPLDVSQTLEAFFGGIYVQDFLKDSIRYPIKLKGPDNPWNLSELYITNPEGRRISLATVATLEPAALPNELEHYNQLRSATLNVTLYKHQTIPEVMKKLDTLRETALPKEMLTSWSGTAKLYIESSTQMLWLFFMALLFIYGILAIQFESFWDPLLIILTVPLGCAGALAGLWLTGQSLNIYTQIGLVTLIGLITKHGILIVEFANQLRHEEKLSPMEAAQKAALLRLRPILMTTAAMILGAFPLVLASGAGAESRRAIGLVLAFGLSVGTFLTLFVIPMTYGVAKGFFAQKVRT